MRNRFSLFVTVASLTIATACTSPPPPPASAPPPPPAAPSVLPPVADWRDLPISPGTWTYKRDAAGSAASFGQANAQAAVTLACNKNIATLTLSVTDAADRDRNATSLKITTSFGEAALPARYAPASPSTLQATLAATNPLLDQIAFSRGRFMIETPGGGRMRLSAWPEVSRVIEDCRG